MLQVTLGDKTYTADYVRAQALREIGPTLNILQKLDGKAAPVDFGKDLDVMVRWFCLVFGGQFTMDDVYKHYPADRLLTDLYFAVSVVKGEVSAALIAFPTRAGSPRTETPQG